MKRFIPIILVLAMALTQACEGPEGKEGAPGPQGTPGAPGTQGPQGPPGESADSAMVFDFSTDFTLEDSSEVYTAFLPFSGNQQVDLEVSDSDVILVYALAGSSPNPDDADNPIPFWSPLPRRYDTAQGSLTYNFAYSTIALILFIESELDLATLPGATNDQIFRAVVIPGKRLGGRTTGAPLTKAELNNYPIDLKDYNAVIKHFKIDDKNVRKVSLK